MKPLHNDAGPMKMANNECRVAIVNALESDYSLLEVLQHPIPLLANNSTPSGAKPYRAVYANIVIYPFFKLCVSIIFY